MNPPINLPSSIHSGPNTQQTSKDEVSLIEVLGVLVKQKNLILASAAILTLLSVGYVLVGMPAPTYRTTTGFLLPQETLSPKPIPSKKSKELAKLKESIYQKFLAQTQSYSFQKEVFDSGDFLKRFIDDVSASTRSERVLLGIHNSITLKRVVPNKNSALPEKPVFLEMVGSKPEAMEDFLNTLVETAIINIQDEALHITKKSIDQRLKTISREKELLRKSLDTQAKRALADEIKLLAEQLNMARSLNIKENNFGVPNKAPKWFLYGEKILAAELNVLKSKAASLDNITRVDNKKLLAMEIELEKWKATKAYFKNPRVVVISQPSISLMQPSKSKRIIIITAMMIGLILGVLLAFIKTGIDILRENEELPVYLESDSKRFEFKNSPQTFHTQS